MATYRPGQGLNKEALERLRMRRILGESSTDLPAQDDSKQWDQLLGVGAKKKTRCSICTRPLEDDSVSSSTFLCSSCASSSGMKVNTSAREHSKTVIEHDKTCTAAKQRSSTPSTDTGSDYADGSMQATPRGEEHLQKKMMQCRTSMTHAAAKTTHTSSIETEVILEVQTQLRTLGNQGFVWIDAWNEKYLRRLGTLRSFLEKHPDKFTIIPLKGKGYRVALAGRACRPKSRR